MFDKGCALCGRFVVDGVVFTKSVVVALCESLSPSLDTSVVSCQVPKVGPQRRFRPTLDRKLHETSCCYGDRYLGMGMDVSSGDLGV